MDIRTAIAKRIKAATANRATHKNAVRGRALGDRIEQLALAFLQRQGLHCLTRNFYCRSGEIDIIMWEQNVLVFVEVRYRQHRMYGTGAESVTVAKQRKLRRAAQTFLQKHRLGESCVCRFDVIAVNGSATQESSLEFDWIQDAF